MVEKLIWVGHLKQYVRTIGRRRKTTQNLVVQALAFSATPRVVIHYIHRGPIDDIYNSKWKRQRLLHAVSKRERVSSIQHNFSKWGMRPVDDRVTFPLVNASRVLQPHEDALVLTLGISGFDVRRVLVDPGSLVDLLQMSAYKQMNYSTFALRTQSDYCSGLMEPRRLLRVTLCCPSKLAQSS